MSPYTTSNGFSTLPPTSPALPSVASPSTSSSHHQYESDTHRTHFSQPHPPVQSIQSQRSYPTLSTNHGGFGSPVGAGTSALPSPGPSSPAYDLSRSHPTGNRYAGPPAQPTGPQTPSKFQKPRRGSGSSGQPGSVGQGREYPVAVPAAIPETQPSPEASTSYIVPDESSEEADRIQRDLEASTRPVNGRTTPTGPSAKSWKRRSGGSGGPMRSSYVAGSRPPFSPSSSAVASPPLPPPSHHHNLVAASTPRTIGKPHHQFYLQASRSDGSVDPARADMGISSAPLPPSHPPGSGSALGGAWEFVEEPGRLDPRLDPDRFASPRSAPPPTTTDGYRTNGDQVLAPRRSGEGRDGNGNSPKPVTRVLGAPLILSANAPSHPPATSMPRSSLLTDPNTAAAATYYLNDGVRQSVLFPLGGPVASGNGRRQSLLGGNHVPPDSAPAAVEKSGYDWNEPPSASSSGHGAPLNHASTAGGMFPAGPSGERLTRKERSGSSAGRKESSIKSVFGGFVNSMNGAIDCPSSSRTQAC